MKKLLLFLCFFSSNFLYADETIKLSCNVSGIETANSSSLADKKNIDGSISAEVLIYSNLKSSDQRRPLTIINLEGQPFSGLVTNEVKGSIKKVYDLSDKNVWDMANVDQTDSYNGHTIIKIDRNTGSITAKKMYESEGILYKISVFGSCEKINSVKRKF